MQPCEQLWLEADAGPIAQSEAARATGARAHGNADGPDFAGVMAECFGGPAILAVRGAAGESSAAAWRIGSGRVRFGALPFSILTFRKSGTSAVTKIAGRQRSRKRLRVGSATFVPAHTPVEWLFDGPCTALHVYLSPEMVRNHAAQCLDLSATPRIDDFFAIEDPWLTSYFGLLVNEYETFLAGPVAPDGLFIEQTQRVLVRHLVRWHSDSRSAARAELDGRRPVNSLRPFLVRRIQDYVDAHVADDISLTALAELATMSPGHFLRSFKAATGSTPYRYVLERRLDKASRMVRTTGAPIGLVARECGFRTPNYFTARFQAHFGVSPMKYRGACAEGD